VEAYPNETFTGVVSQVRPQSGSVTSSGAPAPSATGGGGTATAGVTFLTVITVANPERRLRPGMTATVFLTGLERGDVLRIPNQALLFRPSLDLLKSVGETVPSDPRTGSSSDEQLAEVWTYDGKRFAPVAVAIGLSDAQWAEQTTGSLKSGDKLVINTSFKK
jgi:HlyD family secretion protein